MNTIDLSNLAEGAVAEQFNIELSKVLENIADPNTDAKKVRKVTLTVSLKANENRDIAAVGIVAKSTIVPRKDIETQIILDHDSKGNVVGKELKSGIKGQTFIDNDGDVADDTGEKIINFRKTGGSN